MKILGSHVRIEIADLERTKEYLGKSLGMAPVRELRKPDGSAVVWYPGLEIAQSAQQTPGLISHLAWEVDDIQEAMRALKSNGVVFDTDEPRQIDSSCLDTKELVHFVFFQSPLGFRGELYQITPAAGPKETDD